MTGADLAAIPEKKEVSDGSVFIQGKCNQITDLTTERKQMNGQGFRNRKQKGRRG